MANEQIAECAGFSDRNLDEMMQRVQNHIDKVAERNPRIPRVKVSSGMRGTRYYVEFPIVGKNVDAFRIYNYVKSKLDQAHQEKRAMVRVTGKDSYINEENVAYLLDYQVESGKVQGSPCSGSCYVRGVKGAEGWDSFKFILEKSNDFNAFDAELVAFAYEMALSNLQTSNQP